MKALSCFFLVMYLVFLRPLSVQADVTFTDAEYERVVQIMDQLKTLNENNQQLVKNLQQTNKQLQGSYKKQKIYYITAGILITISASLISYEVGAHK